MTCKFDAEWARHAGKIGYTPFVCKTSYVIGTLRQMLASAGLCLQHNYHLAALFLGLDATELLGRCEGGYQDQRNQATNRLKTGLRYLEAIDPEPAACAHSIDEYVNLRNFLGHGAASSNAHIKFEPWSTVRLLQLVALALDDFWTQGPDSSQRFDNLARAEIQPLLTDIGGVSEPIFVRDVLQDLVNGNSPGHSIAFDDWRGQRHPLDNTTPAASGFGP